MAFDFPNNPTDGQTVLHDNGKYYKWDATAGIWNIDVGKRIQDFIDGLIDAAPGTLDTLNELAAAINDDPAVFQTLTTNLATLQSDVDQNELDSDLATAANLALLTAQRALEWDAVFATHGSLYATTTTVG